VENEEKRAPYWTRVRTRITSRSDQLCNNIKLYRAEKDQSYAFVVKDKDDTEIRSHLSSFGFDELTKAMIKKVANQQQQIPMKMTTEQWNINRLKKFLMASKEEIVFQAPGSSVYSRDSWFTLVI